MENAEEIRQVTFWFTLGVGAIATIVLAIFWEKLSKFAKWLQPDPEKGFKATMIIFLAIYVVIALVVSFVVMGKMLKEGTPFSKAPPRVESQETVE